MWTVYIFFLFLHIPKPMWSTFQCLSSLYLVFLFAAFFQLFLYVSFFASFFHSFAATILCRHWRSSLVYRKYSTFFTGSRTHKFHNRFDIIIFFFLFLLCLFACYDVLQTPKKETVLIVVVLVIIIVVVIIIRMNFLLNVLFIVHISFSML